MPQQRGLQPKSEPPLPPSLKDSEVVYDDNQAQVQQQKRDFPTGGSLIPNLGIGALKGAASDVGGLIGAANKVGGWMENNIGSNSPAYKYLHGAGVQTPDIPTPPPNYTEPSNYQQSLGKQGQQMVDYGLAGAAAPYSAIPQGLAMAGVTGLHGGSALDMAGNAVMGALGPTVSGMISNSLPGRAARGIYDWMSSKVPTPPPGAASSATKMLRGAAPAVSEALQTTPKASYEFSGGEPQVTVHPPEAPTPPPAPKQVGSGTVPGQKQLSAPAADSGGGNFQGQEGGLGVPKNQTVTPTKVPHVAVKDEATGRFRKATDSEVQDFANKVVQSKSNVGKGPAPVEAPAPPPKKKGK